jgi:hypothetical protein
MFQCKTGIFTKCDMGMDRFKGWFRLIWIRVRGQNARLCGRSAAGQQEFSIIQELEEKP